MTESTFSRIAGELFREVLTVHGFTSAGCKTCTLYRWATADILHVIRGELKSRGTTFVVRVFPTSPVIDPDFRQRFPDDLGDSIYYSGLSDHGVGHHQTHFRCREEAGLRRNFAREVQPLLERFAVSYLDRFHSIRDLASAIQNPNVLGFALAAVGEKQRARELLKTVRERYESGPPDPETTLFLQAVNRTLAELGE